jgi:hypothetical protein
MSKDQPCGRWRHEVVVVVVVEYPCVDFAARVDCCHPSTYITSAFQNQATNLRGVLDVAQYRSRTTGLSIDVA